MNDQDMKLLINQLSMCKLSKWMEVLNIIRILCYRIVKEFDICFIQVNF